MTASRGSVPRSLSAHRPLFPARKLVPTSGGEYPLITARNLHEQKYGQPKTRLQELRWQLGLTLREVRWACGVSSTSQVASHEHGNYHPSGTHMRRYADFYGVEVEWLFPSVRIVNSE